jgi:signal transduction histidine kinase
MLRELGIRAKLLALLSAPLVLILVLSVLIVGHRLGQVGDATRVQHLVATSGAVNVLVHELQAERAAALGWAHAQTPENQAVLLAQRQQVDAALAARRLVVAGVPMGEFSPALAKGFARAGGEPDGLGPLRERVDAAQSPDHEVSDAYEQIIGAYLALPALLALAAGDDELAASLGGYGLIATVIEASAHERDLLATAFATGGITRDTYADLVGVLATQDSALRALESSADPEQLRRLRAGAAGPDPARLAALRLRAGDLVTAQTGPADPRDWTDVANGRIDALVAVESFLVSDLERAAATRVDALRRQAAVVVGLFALALTLTLAVALTLARRVVQPLVTLARVATEAADDMPVMVERMRHRNAEPAVLTPIAVTSGDEFGRLAAAFNTVNAAAVRSATDQAELRAGVAKMFVNVARRNQVLLGRQLTLIDAMERDQQDPDALENLFTLDHLATRMRRNAEGLLVLAGLDSTRRLREGLALSDVIRTAVSEIESYHRVDLDVAEDAQLHGRSALGVAHLLAELLDNATHFSNPDTRVEVSCRPGAGGIEVTITDQGLGMGAEELAAANAVITSPFTADVVVSQRLGFLVVGRLAQHLGIAVALRPGAGASAGTVVTLTLPEALFAAPVTTREPGRDDLDAPVPVTPAPVAVPAPRSAAPRGVPAAPTPPIALVQPVLPPVPALRSAPAIDILPGDGGSRRHRRRTAAGSPGAPTPVYVAPATSAQDASVLAAFVASAAPPTLPRHPLDHVGAGAGRPSGTLVGPETPYAPDRLAAAAPAPERLAVAGAPAVAASGLARRVPRPGSAPPTPIDEPPDTIAADDRPRTASDVRGMLSGFRAGVERGRITSATRSDGADQ